MDRKTVLAVVLSLAVIFIYQFFLLPKPQPRISQPPPAPPAATIQTAPAETAVSVPSPAAIPPAGELAQALSIQEQFPGRIIEINTGAVSVKINTEGGRITDWNLLKYNDIKKMPLNLIPKAINSGTQSLAIEFKDQALTDRFASGTYHLIGEGGSLSPSSPQRTITLTRADESGLILTKKITFKHDSYLADLDVEVKNTNPTTLDMPWWVNWGPGISKEGQSTVRNISMPVLYDGIKLHQEKVKKDGDRISVPASNSWCGIADNYFLAALIPSTPERSFFFKRINADYLTLSLGPSSGILASGGGQRILFRLFAGPKSLDLLKKTGFGLENAVDFGWSAWFGKPLLSVLKFFHEFSRNWGISIILLTLMVKLLLFPVTFNMYKSMKRMQEFQPQIALLKKKFKDDPQALNRETMELYRAHKINPMGGCLPMIIQIPVFFALYKVLTIAIELRGATFLHIADLSAGETTLGEFFHSLAPAIPAGILPIKLLVVLMGLTMFIQQKLSPTAADPRQAKMMMFFPLIMVAMFWNFSSGLVVYFLFSNIFAIGEQFIFRRFTPSPYPAAETSKR